MPVATTAQVADRATTDSLGIFTLFEVPVGSYLMAVDSAALGDSLSVIDETPVAVAFGDTSQVNVGVSYPVLTLDDALGATVGGLLLEHRPGGVDSSPDVRSEARATEARARAHRHAVDRIDELARSQAVYGREVRYGLWVDDPESEPASGLRIPVSDAVIEVHVADETDPDAIKGILALFGEERVKVITKSRLGWLEERTYK